jgi:aspartyl aminopeptidase
MLMASWLDRPLSVAGRVVVRDGEKLVTRLVNLERDLALIPNLAIHMDRGQNEGKNYDPKTDLLPLIGSEASAGSFRRLVAENAGVDDADLVSAELQLYPRTAGTVWGAEEEYISSPRLDDLQCVFACAEGFLHAGEGESVPVLAVFDNEEVGSSTRQGAGSGFLADTLARVAESLGLGGVNDYRRLLARSFLVSADNAHAVHPNHPEYADRVDRPVLNGGVVIKANANQRYTTDAVSAAVFSERCRRAGVPTQRYTNRADLPGGSTLGNISLSQVAVRSVDIGLPQLAMHSCYETAGARDTAYLVTAAQRFFESSLRIEAESVALQDGRCGQ